MRRDNVGKCGHARCAGGNGCLERGTPMRSYEEIKEELELEAMIDEEQERISNSKP